MDEIDGRRDEDGNAQGRENSAPFHTTAEFRGLAAQLLIHQDDGALHDPRRKGQIERLHHQATYAGKFPVIPVVWRARRDIVARVISGRGPEFQSVELRGLVAGLVAGLPVGWNGLGA